VPGKIPQPQPKAGEALVKFHATAIMPDLGLTWLIGRNLAALRMRRYQLGLDSFRPRIFGMTEVPFPFSELKCRFRNEEDWLQLPTIHRTSKLAGFL
jgi:hypothetical protein